MRSSWMMLALSHLVCALAGLGLGWLVVEQMPSLAVTTHGRVASLLHRQATALAFELAPGAQVLQLLKSRPSDLARAAKLPEERMLDALREASLFGDGSLASPKVSPLMRRAERACRQSRDQDCAPDALATRRRALAERRSRGRASRSTH